MPTVKRFEIERQLNSLISYLARSRHTSIKESALEYTINSSDITNKPDV